MLNVNINNKKSYKYSGRENKYVNDKECIALKCSNFVETELLITKSYFDGTVIVYNDSYYVSNNFIQKQSSYCYQILADDNITYENITYTKINKKNWKIIPCKNNDLIICKFYGPKNVHNMTFSDITKSIKDYMVKNENNVESFYIICWYPSLYFSVVLELEFMGVPYDFTSPDFRNKTILSSSLKETFLKKIKNNSIKYYKLRDYFLFTVFPFAYVFLDTDLNNKHIKIMLIKTDENNSTINISYPINFYPMNIEINDVNDVEVIMSSNLKNFTAFYKCSDKSGSNVIVQLTEKKSQETTYHACSIIDFLNSNLHNSSSKDIKIFSKYIIGAHFKDIILNTTYIDVLQILFLTTNGNVISTHITISGNANYTIFFDLLSSNGITDNMQLINNPYTMHIDYFFINNKDRVQTISEYTGPTLCLYDKYGVNIVNTYFGNKSQNLSEYKYNSTHLAFLDNYSQTNVTNVGTYEHKYIKYKKKYMLLKKNMFNVYKY